MQMSDVACAQIELSRGGEVCTYCGTVFNPLRLIVIGTSVDPRYGYIGGLFCPSEWLTVNFSPENERTLKMTQEELEKLGIPKAKSFVGKPQGEKDWDKTHSDLINLDVLVISYRPITTQYGDAYLADCFLDGKRLNILIGAQVLMEQLAEVKDDLPMWFSVIKPKKSYIFVAPRNTH